MCPLTSVLSGTIVVHLKESVLSEFNTWHWMVCNEDLETKYNKWRGVDQIKCCSFHWHVLNNLT
jgi:hypothetical protein